MESSELSMSDVGNVLRRNKFKFAFSFLFIMACTVVVTIVTPRNFESEARLLVRLGRENATLDPTTTLGEGSGVNISHERQFETNSVATMLRSRPLAERVVDAIGHDAILNESIGSSEPEAREPGFRADLEELLDRIDVAAAKQWVRDLLPSSGVEIGLRDEAIRELGDSLRVEPLLETNVIRIAYRSENPDLSQKVVSSVIENYLEEHVRIHRSAGAHTFLADHKQLLQDELSRAESELVELKNRTGLVSPDEQRSILVTRLGALKTELFTLEATLTERQAEVDEFTHSLATLSSGPASQHVGTSSEGADGMRTQLYELQLLAQDALARYSENHIKMRQLNKQMEAAKKILAMEEASIEIEERKPFLASTAAKIEKLREQIGQVESELRLLNESEMAVAQLQRSVEIRDTTYRRLAASAEQSRIDQSLELAKITNISVVQPATRDLYAVFPNTKLNLAIGFFLAIFLNLGLAVFAAARNATKPSVINGRTPSPVMVPQETPVMVPQETPVVVTENPPVVVAEKPSAAIATEAMSLSKPR